MFAFEKPAASLDDAALQCKTGYYWYIYGGNDYTGFDFDFVPPPWQSTHLHTWPSQHQRCGDVYLAHVDAVANRQWHFHTTPVHRNPVREAWDIPSNIDDSKFDYSWHPDPTEPPYEYHFGTQWQRTGGPVYKGPAGIKRVDAPRVTALVDMSKWAIPANIDDSDFDYSWHPDVLEPPYEYHFGTQWQTTGGPVYKGTAGVKRVSSQRVQSLVDMSKWSVPADIDDSAFDYSWHPDVFEPDYEYQFGTQHQREGGPVYKGTAGVKYASNQKIQMGATQIFYMDFLNPESSEQFIELQKEFPTIKRTRYVSDHLNVLKRIMAMATTEFVWVASSVCDYSKFDFTWHPEHAQREMIHCFANGHGNWNELRGDTFYIHVESFKNQMIELELLDWFNVINYVNTESVERWPVPVVQYDTDDLVQAIKDYNFTTSYAVFSNREFGEDEVLVDCLWTEKDRWCRPLSTSNAISVIPRDIKQYLKTQVYDYPHLWKYEEGLPFNYYADNALDIVYISNGEPDAERWYNNLEKILAQKLPVADLPRFVNKLHRVQNVNGRVAAYQAAARASTTPWFFAVFAKLEVDMNFDFRWQPDYWQAPKHYIFNAKNIVNGLEYGHMGMIAYNKRLVLENNNPGIDFTLSQPHESVPVLSGIAHFNQDAWTTWRTAFREVLKLRMFMETSPTLETEHRLKVWTTKAACAYGQYSLDGARDALAYYDEVGGDPAKLQLSFDWDWLRTRFDK